MKPPRAEVVHVTPKDPEIARADRRAGAVLAFGVFLVVVIAATIALRRLRARAERERAERELRDVFEKLDHPL
jgi:C4-dicarboxylate-specific signal transduction histidine kinase